RRLAVDALRILDLCFTFPYLLLDFDFPRGAGREGRALAGTRSKYNELPAPRSFLQQLSGLHSVAFAALAGKGLVEGAQLRSGVLQRTTQPIPEQLNRSLNDFDVRLATFLATKLGTLSLLGKDGIKA